MKFPKISEGLCVLQAAFETKYATLKHPPPFTYLPAARLLGKREMFGILSAPHPENERNVWDFKRFESRELYSRFFTPSAIRRVLSEDRAIMMRARWRRGVAGGQAEAQNGLVLVNTDTLWKETAGIDALGRRWSLHRFLS